MIAPAEPVALVGAGPGDPELLTLRAEDLLRQAGIVIVERTLEPLARRFAVRAAVVAVPDRTPCPQVVLAAAGRGDGPVVRLYRGDPWLHDAFAPEQAALQAAGHRVEAVAGVAVEVAVPALAGVPLHVRSLAVVCTLGAARALPAARDAAWTLVASGQDPGSLAGVVAGTGDPGLPAALVPLDGSTAGWQGLLGGAPAAAAAMTAPALLVVGAVCEVAGGEVAGGDRPVPGRAGHRPVGR